MCMYVVKARVRMVHRASNSPVASPETHRLVSPTQETQVRDNREEGLEGGELAIGDLKLQETGFSLLFVPEDE